MTPREQTLEHECARLTEENAMLKERCRLMAQDVMADAIRTWIPLTDEDRKAAFESLPDMLDGFLNKWGWLHFSKEIERRCRLKNDLSSRGCAMTHAAETIGSYTPVAAKATGATHD